MSGWGYAFPKPGNRGPTEWNAPKRCWACGQPFSNPNALDRHLRLMHDRAERRSKREEPDEEPDLVELLLRSEG